MHNYTIIEKGAPLQQAKRALILIHGRGGTADDILFLAKEFCDDTFYIAAPQATGNSWYPYSFLAKRERNEPLLSCAVDVIHRLIKETEIHIPASEIYIMGFSQGACLALESTARYARRYAGIIAFTGGLIGDKLSIAEYQGYFEKTKIFIGNSDLDPHVPLNRSEESKKILENMGADVKLNIYPDMPHTIITEEVKYVKKWMF